MPQLLQGGTRAEVIEAFVRWLGGLSGKDRLLGVALAQVGRQNEIVSSTSTGVPIGWCQLANTSRGELGK
jgi:hypothetical protein